MSAAIAAPVHTSAQEADLFDNTAAAPVLIEFDGRLLHDAEVRSIPVGDGAHVYPVLCLDLAPLSGLHHTICAQQVFTEVSRKDAEAAAKSLRKGMRVTLTAPLDGMRIKLPHIARVVAHQEP